MSTTTAAGTVFLSIGRCPICRHDIIDVVPHQFVGDDRWSIAFERQDGTVCCSEFESEFGSSAEAQRQCRAVRRYVLRAD